jgi:hypothetical protein
MLLLLDRTLIGLQHLCDLTDERHSQNQSLERVGTCLVKFKSLLVPA